MASRNLEKVETKIVPRQTSDGALFTELLHTYVVDGQTYYALSRLNFVVSPGRYAEQAQNEAFRVRFNRALQQGS